MSDRPVTELFSYPDLDPRPQGIRVGDLVYFSHLTGADPASGRFDVTLTGQIAQLFQNVRRTLEDAELGPENLGHLTFFMPDLTERKQFNAPWVELFPDPLDRPPYKYLPAPLPAPSLIEAEVYAVVGGRRTVIDVPGVVHMDPIPIGVRIGKYLFSSRIMGTDPATGRSVPDLEEQSALCLRHMQTLVQGAGAALGHLTQGIVFVRRPEDARFLVAGWCDLFPNESDRPVLHVLTTDLPGLVVRLEVMGVLEG